MHRDNSWLVLAERAGVQTLKPNLILSQTNVYIFQFVSQIKNFAHLLTSVRKPAFLLLQTLHCEIKTVT